MSATSFHPAALGTILSIWAHPDDETYLAAGVMARARDFGQRVVCVSATAGEHGTGDPVAWPSERLGAVRRYEAAAAMAVLGVVEHEVLDLPDGDLDGHETAGRAWVARMLDLVQPDSILTFGADGITYHPDHIAVHRWVTAVWAARGRRARLLYATPTLEHLHQYGERYETWDMYMSDERPGGVPEAELTVHVRLEGAALDRKLAALRAMATQTNDLVTMLGVDEYAEFVADECFVDADPARRPRPTLAPTVAGARA